MKAKVNCCTCGREVPANDIRHTLDKVIVDAVCPICGRFTVSRYYREMFKAIEATAGPLKNWYYHDGGDLSKEETAALKKLVLIIGDYSEYTTTTE